MSVSSTSIGNNYEVPIGTATGISAGSYWFGFMSFGDDSINAAIQNALKKHPSANSMANVYVDRKATCFPICALPLAMEIETRIFGTLIKYKVQEVK